MPPAPIVSCFAAVIVIVFLVFVSSIGFKLEPNSLHFSSCFLFTCSYVLCLLEDSWKVIGIGVVLGFLLLTLKIFHTLF